MVTTPRRGRLAAACSVAVLALSGCGTLRAFPGPERPDAEVAVITGYNRNYLVYWDEAHVSSVDGLRPAGWAPWVRNARVLPGRHWVEVTRHATVGGYTVCAFATEFAAGHRYTMRAHGLHTETPYLEQVYGGFFRGTLVLEVSAPGAAPELRTVDTLCAPRGATPSFCARDADCTHYHGAVCRPVPESTFGTCAPRGE